jgi:hypothetical protein
MPDTVGLLKAEESLLFPCKESRRMFLRCDSVDSLKRKKGQVRF